LYVHVQQLRNHLLQLKQILIAGNDIRMRVSLRVKYH